MSGDGAPELTVDGRGLKIEIVASLWHTDVMDGLVAGAVRAAQEAGADYRVTRVAGAFELTVVAEKLARAGADAIAALGVVVQGETPHFEYVCASATDGLTAVAREHAVPVGFGLLTVDDVQQALDRAGLEGSKEDKGAEAVEAALSTALILRGL
ncbi:6,7-dimethyl-8-ribityllumazine synthase [Demequina sp. NBRC 110055]|uniref:6,7-dimethyl-8-ribityllumazine synthase n=1 Tax=Demequina sp. NBRC 110055 TaxID=1570344 RepID=UPI000A07BE50|nr:6,7-dimethyl-8-ribityllumazine synthase [Demequina sp. NBRC 110055]